MSRNIVIDLPAGCLIVMRSTTTRHTVSSTDRQRTIRTTAPGSLCIHSPEDLPDIVEVFADLIAMQGDFKREATMEYAAGLEYAIAQLDELISKYDPPAE